MTNSRNGAFTLGLFIFLGLAVLGFLPGKAALNYRELERTVTVKGLSEHEYPADIVIWPIQFTAAGNDLAKLYSEIESSNEKIRGYLTLQGIEAGEISISSPAITDKSAQNYSNNQVPELRYSSVQTVTVYSKNIERVQNAMSGLAELGKQGIVFNGGNYQARTEYLFTRLNDVKPTMIEEATTKAREVAQKFPMIRAASWEKSSAQPRANFPSAIETGTTRT